MGKLNIKELFDNIEFKGNSAKIILRWFIGIIGFLLISAFLAGQIKTNFINNLKKIEKNTNKNYVLIKQNQKLIREQNKTFNIITNTQYNDLDNRINKIYFDGIDALNEYKNYSNKQLKLIIDYSQNNKELLKKVIDMNSEEYYMKTKEEVTKSILEKKDTIINNKNDFIPVIKIKPIK